MTTDAELTQKFWKALRSDRTFLIGLSGAEAGHARPMTANFLDDRTDSIWMFTSRETELAAALGEGAHRAAGYFCSKDHDLFAAIDGELSSDDDPDIIERLWSPFVAAWFEGGKTDPKLRLLRYTPSSAEIWLNENSLLAGIRLLLGADPKKDYRDKVAKVRL